MSPLCHHHAGHRHGLQCILPPYILDWLEETGDADDAAAAAQTRASLALVRQKRVVTALLIADPAIDTQALGLLPADGSAIKVYDAHGLPFTSFALPGTLLRSTNDPAVSDTEANQAFDGARDTLDFYSSVLGRNGIDDHGMDVISSVHVSDQDGSSWANAAWIGTQMVYGEGGRFFRPGSLTSRVDVIGHELTHGVTEHTARLEYRSQSGALNESMSDCFGSMIKQRVNRQSAADADWLIGEGLLVNPAARALRSMLDPGSAFRGDPQPGTMSNYRQLPETEQGDNGGVHINSGIPNHAFALAATRLGGNSWDQAGKIWYQALTRHLRSDAQFRDAAEATLEAADELFPGGTVRGVVEDAWKAVEVLS
ncbi:M4 family metallopeptidase [Conexibacter woesei]|uniref:M4 family metallopeptidase n=1 Tax=Conexibacter woesei TaxID=191495 RepID=UPI00042793F9|nr:M4 family metallopeptidase [Conexibacter woesei]